MTSHATIDISAAGRVTIICMHLSWRASLDLHDHRVGPPTSTHLYQAPTYHVVDAVRPAALSEPLSPAGRGCSSRPYS